MRLRYGGEDANVSGDEPAKAPAMTVYLAVCTYNYEDEHGGVTHAVFSTEAAAEAYIETRRQEGGPYTWDVVAFEVDDAS